MSGSLRVQRLKLLQQNQEHNYVSAAAQTTHGTSQAPAVGTTSSATNDTTNMSRVQRMKFLREQAAQDTTIPDESSENKRHALAVHSIEKEEGSAAEETEEDSKGQSTRNTIGGEIEAHSLENMQSPNSQLLEGKSQFKGPTQALSSLFSSPTKFIHLPVSPLSLSLALLVHFKTPCGALITFHLIFHVFYVGVYMHATTCGGKSNN
jgi:hypothetical protein